MMTNVLPPFYGSQCITERSYALTAMRPSSVEKPAHSFFIRHRIIAKERPYHIGLT